MYKLTSSLSGVNFITEEGKGITGYTLTGADTVFPFKSGDAIFLGTGTSFDVKSFYPNYSELTVDDFIVASQTYKAKASATSTIQNASGSGWYSHTIKKTYDATTGILSVSGTSSTDTYYALKIESGASNIVAFLVIQ